MARYRYNPQTGEWFEIHKGTGAEVAPQVFIVPDRIPAQESGFDGKVYDSRSALKRAAQAHGLVRKDPKERIKKPEYVPQGVRESYMKALYQLGLKKD